MQNELWNGPQLFNHRGRPGNAASNLTGTQMWTETTIVVSDVNGFNIFLPKTNRFNPLYYPGQPNSLIPRSILSAHTRDISGLIVHTLNAYILIASPGHCTYAQPSGEPVRSPVDSSYEGQWQGTLVMMFSLIGAWTIGWANNRDTGDLRRHRAYYDVTVMLVHEPDFLCATSPTHETGRIFHELDKSWICVATSVNAKVPRVFTYPSQVVNIPVRILGIHLPMSRQNNVLPPD